MHTHRSLCVLTLALALTAAGCEQDVLDSECDPIVLNESSCGLSTWVDGQEAFAVRAGVSRALSDVGPV